MRPTRWSRARVTVAVALAYVVITLVMTHPYVNLGALDRAAYSGDASLMIWTLAWSNHALLDGVPLFDANIFYPAAGSLRYNDPLVGISLFTLPIYAATRNPILAYNVVFLLTFVLNALAMYWLALRVTGRTMAAFVGGVVYAYSFYVMLHAHGHLSLIWVWLLPLSLLLHDRWVESPTPGRAALWGAAVLGQVLASWYLAVIALVATGVMVAWRHVVDVRDRWVTRVGQMALVGLVGTVAVWPLAAPYRTSLGSPDLVELRRYSADWASYLMPPENTIVGQWWLAQVGLGPRWIWGELTLFLGWTALALAAVGLLAMIRDRAWRRTGVFVALAAVGLVLSFGPDAAGGAFGFLRRLPGVEAFRVPARFGLLVLLGVAMLAACGAAAIVGRFGRRAEVALGLLVPLMLAEWYVVGFPSGQPRPVSIPAIYRRPEIGTARAIVSLPDYSGTDEWARGADYLLYSTVHWRPIVNGYGRAEPPDHSHVVSHMRAFPGPNNARTMRELGVEYLVLHTARVQGGASALLEEATASPEYELVAVEGLDYLFRVRDGLVAVPGTGNGGPTTE